MSNEVNGMPLTLYRMQADYDNDNIIINSFNQITGYVETVESEPASNADIIVSIPEADWTFEPFQADASGNFVFNYHAPAIPDNYTLQFVIGKGERALTKNLYINVKERPEKGHDLSLNEVIIDKDYYKQNETINITNTIYNNSSGSEINCQIENILYDENYNQVAETFANFDIAKDETKNIYTTITIPVSTGQVPKSV